MTSDTRYYETFYGIRTDDWSSAFGSLTDHETHLVKDYLSDACSCASKTPWSSSGTKFFYPHRIKQKYWIEGVVEGHLTFASATHAVHSVVTSQVSDYRVSIWKMHTDTTEMELATTGVINISASYPTTGGVEFERVFPFWIDVDEPKELGENERIVVKVEWDVGVSGADSSDVTADLSHWNWATTEDFKITIPFVL